MEMNNQTDYDVVVIGAGLAGLTTATKLQKLGAKVLLLEQHFIVGGYASNFKRKGYEFDASIHFFPGAGKNGGMGKILKLIDVETKVEFIPLESRYRSVFPNHTLEWSNDLDVLISTLQQFFPHEKENIVSYFSDMRELYKGIQFITSARYLGEMSFFKMVTGFLRNIKAILKIGKYMDKPYYEFLQERIKDPQLKGLLAQAWGYIGTPPRELSLLFFVNATYSFFEEGGYYVKGGSQNLSNAIAAAFQEHGGELRTSHDVTEILIKHGTATGVTVFDKNKKTAYTITSQVIISCCDNWHTFKDLVGFDKLPSSFIEKLQSLKPAMSVFAVYLGVDMELPEQFKDAYDVLVFNSYDVDELYKGVQAKNFGMYIIAIYSNVCPEFSPLSGQKHVICLLANMENNPENLEEVWKVADPYDTNRSEEYNQIKQDLALQLIEEAEKHIPGLKKSIEVIEIGTPVTFQRYTRNYGGSYLGWSNIVEQSILKRQGNITPIKNLFTTSQWTFPGGGVAACIIGGGIC
ncbi:MAG: phytoene desaturase family protein, partial [Candidatus Hodarchaeota archaeon]